MASRSEIEREVRRFVGENFILEDADAIEGGASLTRTGILDSMGVLELIMFIEERYGLRVPDDQAVPENLDSIERIVRYLAATLAEGDAADVGRAHPVS